jgi:hypothetical protein
MTTVTAVRPPAPTPPPPGRPPRRRRSRRWLRLAGPFFVVAAIVAGSIVAYLLQQPSPKDGGYLSPTATGRYGGSKLAALVRDRGVTVERVTRSSDALVTAYGGGVTLFIPTPNLVHPFYLRMLKLLPASTHVVLVDPSDDTVADALLPVRVGHRALSAHPAEPGCAFAPVRDAGAAAVRRSTFELDLDASEAVTFCYGGGLAVLKRGQAEVSLAGATDPFRNDRIGEHHNAEFAAGLLTQAPKVIWLDLHKAEAEPGYAEDAPPGPAAPPSLGSGSPDPDFPLPDTGRPKLPQPEGGNGDDNPDAGGNPLWQAFPPWVFGSVALIAAAALLLTLARARRLGAPVAEPLPVTVRATETVEGRGRLYQRAKARTPALRTLQEAARERLARALDLGPTPDRTGLVTAVAGRLAATGSTGWSPEAVDTVLFTAEPDTDADLVEAATRLEALMTAVRTAERGAHEHE